MKTELAVRCREVRRDFVAATTVVSALSDIDLDVTTGQLVAVAGPSGSGKSTLLALLSCLDRPTAGTVEVFGESVGSINRRARRRLRREVIGVLVAHPADNLLAGLTGRANLDAVAEVSSWSPIAEQLGICYLLERQPRSMSGGEQMRLALACQLVGGRKLILADEPTGALGGSDALAVAQLLRAASGQQRTVIVATHDPKITDVAHTTIRLDHGRRV